MLQQTLNLDVEEFLAKIGLLFNGMREFILKNRPSINYLELYAVAVAVNSWIYKYKNQRIIIFCDNMSVVNMLNNSSSKCKNCMVLIRIITLKALTFNVKINANHIAGKLNLYSDYLSRLKYKEFWQLARKNNKKIFKTKHRNWTRSLANE